MTQKNKKRCNCRVCQYGAEIQALADRQAKPEDKRRVEVLYESLALAEDDNGMYRGRWTSTKDLICLVKREHFNDKLEYRKDGHDDCKICDLLEHL